MKLIIIQIKIQIMSNNVRRFAEVTGYAVALLALPIGYYYGRPYLLGAQDQAYDKLFKIDDN